MLGPVLWLALAFAVLLGLRVIWLILLQPAAPARDRPAAADATVIRWGDERSVKPTGDGDRVER